MAGPPLPVNTQGAPPATVVITPCPQASGAPSSRPRARTERTPLLMPLSWSPVYSYSFAKTKVEGLPFDEAIAGVTVVVDAVFLLQFFNVAQRALGVRLHAFVGVQHH